MKEEFDFELRTNKPDLGDALLKVVAEASKIATALVPQPLRPAIAQAAVVGALIILSSTLMDRDNVDDVSKITNREAILMAALLAAAAVSRDSPIDEAMMMEFSTTSILKATADFEKLTGHPPDGVVGKWLLEQARDPEQQAKEKVNFAKAMGAAIREVATVN